VGWDSERPYLADPRWVFQVRDIALVLAGRAINVVRRTDNGSWRYAISLLELDLTDPVGHTTRPSPSSA
jgi:hypothetical protein